MIYEEGDFLVEATQWRAEQRFPCRIKIESKDWPKYCFGEFEKHDELPFSVTWCHRNLEWRSWAICYENYGKQYSRTVIFYFSSPDDAVTFKLACQ